MRGNRVGPDKGH